MYKKKFTKTEEKKVIDVNSGEIISETMKSETFTVDSEPPYIKLYIEDIIRLKKLDNSANKVLFELLSQMGYSGVIPVYKPIKQLIAKKLNLSFYTVDNAIKKLKKSGLLIPIVRGMYLADPNLFGRGNWRDIKQLRLVIEYQADGTKKLKSTLPKQLQLKLNFPDDDTDNK